MRSLLCCLLLPLLLPYPARLAVSEEASANDPLQALASELLSASTEAERTTILSAHHDLATPALIQALLGKVPALRSQALNEKGLAVCSFAKEIAERIGDEKAQADALYLSGTLLFEKDQFDAALKSYQEGLAISERIQYVKGKADCLNGMAWVQRRTDDLESAARNAQESLELYKSESNQSGVARALHVQGLIQGDHGEWDGALDLYRQSLKIREELSESLEIAFCYLSMANALGLPLGQADLAQEYYQKAAAIFEKEGERRRLASTYNGLANLSTNRGDLSLALQYHLRSLAISEQSGFKGLESTSLNNIGVIHEIQGNYDLAMNYYERSLRLAQDLGSRRDIYFAMGNVASILARQGKNQEAVDLYQKTLDLCHEIGRPDSAMLNRIADVYDQMDQHQLAYEYYKKSLEGYEKRNEKGNIVSLLPRIAKVQCELKDYSGALENAARAAALAQEIGIPELLWSAQLEEGRAYLASGQTDKARQILVDAIQGIERLRTTVAGAEVEEQVYFQEHTEPYLMLVDLLLSQHKNAEAFAYAEQAKARVLFDVLKGGRVTVTKNMSNQEKEQEERLVKSLKSLNEQLSDEKSSVKPDASRTAELQAGLQKARLDYEAFRTDLYAAHPELAAQRGGFETLGAEDAASILNGSEALLEYFVSNNQTHVFALSKNATGGVDLNVYSIPIAAADLGVKINRFREEIAGRDMAFGAHGQELYALLLKPAEGNWENVRRLIIVPDQQLWDLPFQALQDEKGNFLMEKTSMSYAPSLSVLGEMLKSVDDRNRSRLLALGDPAVGDDTAKRLKALNRDENLGPLPEAAEEVEALARFYGKVNSRILIGPDAREDTLKAQASAFGIIHIAAHGVLSNLNPMYSHLVLAAGKNSPDDGLLEPWEIIKMNLHASMVVLSACETARGKVGAGEGMIGFSWAFFVGGASSVVVSQWRVNSESTTVLMEDFHQLWRQSGGTLSKSEALRKAALDLMKDGKYRHPYYWAGFVIVGNPR